MMRTNICLTLLLSIAGCSVEDVTYRNNGPAEPDASTKPIDAQLPPDADPFVAIAMQCVAVGYAQTANGYYRGVATGRSWTLAEADCADDVGGATHLIVLSTPAEVTYLAAQPGWIGLSDRVTEGAFLTVTGETGDQRPWASGQPDNGSNEDCVLMLQNGLLNDQQCGDNVRYVCECDGKMSTP